MNVWLIMTVFLPIKGYFMPRAFKNRVHCIVRIDIFAFLSLKRFVFHTELSNANGFYRYIWLNDETLTNTTILGGSGPGSNYEALHHTLQISRSRYLPSDEG